MTLASLQALTWGTVAGAVVSAMMLASGESTWPELSRWRRADTPQGPAAAEPATRMDGAPRPEDPGRPQPAAPPAR